MTKTSPTVRALSAMLVLAIAVRLATAVYLGDRADPISGAADQYSYDMLAQRVMAGYGFSFPQDWYPFTRAGEPTAHWSFLYTLYLAGVYAVSGHHPLVARIGQAVLSGFIIWLLYRIGRRLFDERVGLAAALMATGYAYLIFFNAALMTQTFYITCLLAAIEVTLAQAADPTRRGWVVLGVALGLGALFRQTLLLFAPILLGWLWWASRGASLNFRRYASGALVTVVIAAVFVMPWTLRNYLAYHDFLLLNSNGGFWFYASNHPAQGMSFDGTFVPPIPAGLNELAEPAIDRALYGEAARFILADPARFVVLSISRIPHYFWLLPSEQSSVISNLSRLMSFALYLPFMLGGLFLSWRQWRTCLPLYLYVGFDTILHLISWSAPRYRLPSDTVLMVFAGLTLVWALKKLGLSTKTHEDTRSIPA